MNKLNKKGFMMAEVVVVSVVVATVLVTLFVGLNRVSSAYELRNKYYDIDALYLAMLANDEIKENDKVTSLITNGKTTKLTSDHVGELMNYYRDDVNLYFSLYDKNKVNDLKDISNINESTKEFALYLNDSLDFDDEYTYVVVSEICKNEDDCYYYALKVR